MENPWKTLSSTIPYDNKWIRVVENQVLNPSGNPGIYGVVHFKNLAMGIIPLDENYYTWLVGQYRYPLDQYSWEIPEGGGDPAIEPIDSAKRELKEETGITAKKWTLIQEVHTSNCVSDELGIIYVAQELTIGTPQPDEDEALALKHLPFAEAYDMVMEGKITDGISVAGILKAHVLISDKVI